MDPAPFILSALMDPEAFAHFDGLRRRHFPPERLVVGAHLTLFHLLPPGAEAELKQVCAAAAGERAPLAASTTALFSLGRGVAFRIHAPGLEALRDELADRFAPLLSAQDKAPFRPHITVQNKVEPKDARALLAELSAGFRPLNFTLTGLGLWRYRGGPWEAAGRYPFRGVSSRR